MGKPQGRQPTLQFSSQKSTRSTPDTDADQIDHSSATAPELKDILLAMQTSLTSIESKMDAMTARLDGLSHKVDAHESRIAEQERRTSDLEDTAATADTRVREMERVLKTLAAKNEDLESRSRRNNLRILGVPETTATGKMEDYVERLLTTLFGREPFSSVFIVERAHRALAARPVPGAPPRPIIAKLLNYRDRDTALRLAREKGTLRYEDKILSIYPDFTMVIQEQRRKFLQAKKQLQQLHIPYAMLFPARLKVTHGGKQHFFTNPQHVHNFIKTLREKPSDRTPSSPRSQARPEQLSDLE